LLALLISKSKKFANLFSLTPALAKKLNLNSILIGTYDEEIKTVTINFCLILFRYGRVGSTELNLIAVDDDLY
jgi:hypothetical protein